VWQGGCEGACRGQGAYRGAWWDMAPHRAHHLFVFVTSNAADKTFREGASSTKGRTQDW